MLIKEIIEKYNNQINYLDLEIIIASSLGKTREFVLANPKFTPTNLQLLTITRHIKRRMQGEPLSYITKKREFFGLDFEVNKHTLIPRPETELLIEAVISNQQSVTSKKTITSNQQSVTSKRSEKILIIDVGTGSGNIIISIAKNITSYQLPVTGYNFFGIDISKEALRVAKRNAKKHGLNKKIKFLHGDLLSPFIKNLESNVKGQMSIVITANLPYLSKEIFESAPIDVKKFEPKSALYSPKKGLMHYEKLFEQIKKIFVTCHLSLVTCYLEFSPEQKKDLQKLIKEILPSSKTSFQKDLAGKWRMAKISLT